MLGYIIKLGFLVIMIMVALNMFAPEQADKLLATFSETTDIKEDTLKSNLDKATQFTKDTVKEVSDTVKEKLEN